MTTEQMPTLQFIAAREDEYVVFTNDGRPFYDIAFLHRTMVESAMPNVVKVVLTQDEDLAKYWNGVIDTLDLIEGFVKQLQTVVFDGLPTTDEPSAE